MKHKGEKVKKLSFLVALCLIVSMLSTLVNSRALGVGYSAENPNLQEDEINYALGAPYSYDLGSESFLDGYSDELCNILNDGIIPTSQTSGKTVSVYGALKEVVIVFDLGEQYSDINSVNVCGVVNNDETGFSEEYTKIWFSADGNEFERNKDFTLEKEQIEGAVDVFNYYFRFSSDVNARYVKIFMYSTVPLLSLGEIQVIGGETAEDTSNDEKQIVGSGTIGEETAWTLTNDGTLTVSGNCPITNFVSPYSTPWNDFKEKIKRVVIENGITAIGEYAFCDCQFIEAVTIPSTVLFIGNHAFGACLELKSVTIPSSVTAIGEDAFYSCISLETAVIGDSVTTIGEDAFFGCTALKKLKIGSSVTTIGNYAFSRCKSLETVTIPSSVEIVGKSAFEGCEKLNGVTMGKNVKAIEERAFFDCCSLKTITVPASVEALGEMSVGFYPSEEENLAFADFTIYGVVGSAAEAYANENEIGFAELEFCFEFTDSEIFAKDGVAWGIKEGVLLSQLNDVVSGEYIATNANGEELSADSKIGTGTVIADSNGSFVTVAVKGDTDGDGSVTSTDYVQIKKAFSKSISLEGVYALAGDTNGDGEINTTDYVQIKSHFLGNSDIYA
jgi:hypothetical protein